MLELLLFLPSSTHFPSFFTISFFCCCCFTALLLTLSVFFVWSYSASAHHNCNDAILILLSSHHAHANAYAIVRILERKMENFLIYYIIFFFSLLFSWNEIFYFCWISEFRAGEFGVAFESELWSHIDVSMAIWSLQGLMVDLVIWS